MLNVRDQLDWDFIKGENSSKSKIISDLYLPTSLENYPGVTITWTSSKDAIAADGKVTRPPNSGADVSSITLTAAISKGSAAETVKISSLKVLKITNYELNLDKDVAWLTETWAPATLSEAGLTADIILPVEGGAGSTTITWNTSDATAITEDGVITRAEVGGAEQEATLTATLKSSSYTREVMFAVKVLPWTEDDLAGQRRCAQRSGRYGPGTQPAGECHSRKQVGHCDAG